jgi:hypothetical protein
MAGASSGLTYAARSTQISPHAACRDEKRARCSTRNGRIRASPILKMKQRCSQLGRDGAGLGCISPVRHQRKPTLVIEPFDLFLTTMSKRLQSRFASLSR